MNIHDPQVAAMERQRDAFDPDLDGDCGRDPDDLLDHIDALRDRLLLAMDEIHSLKRLLRAISEEAREGAGT